MWYDNNIHRELEGGQNANGSFSSGGVETSESCSWSINKDKYFIYGGSFAPEKCREMFELQKQRFEKLERIRAFARMRLFFCVGSASLMLFWL